MNKVDVTASYITLLHQLQAHLARGLEKALKAVNQQRLLTYWELGRAMDHYLLQHKTRAAYGGQFYQRLSEDLNLGVRTLQHCVRLFRVYPALNIKRPLTWSHYRYLISIPDTRKRRRWEQRIIKEKLNSRELLALLQAERHPTLTSTLPIMQTVPRGRLYHYRLVKQSFILNQPSRIMVDCGFKNCVKPPQTKAQLINKRIVKTFVRDDGRYGISLSKATSNDIYTYVAVVERVVDGDTLIVNVDCGFGWWHQERIRLKGVDAPEKNSIDGDRVTRWVTETLAPCTFVVIKTYKPDKYGRYLADIFYEAHQNNPHLVARHGHVLNQVMIQEGLARRYKVSSYF